MSGRIKREMAVERLPIIGKIKIGEKVITKNGKEIPKSLDYFRVESKYDNKFIECYGEKPQLLKVVFLSNNEKEICNERYEYRMGSKIFAEGDGETFLVWSEEIKSYIELSTKKEPHLMQMIEQKCGNPPKRIVTIRFLLPEIHGLLGVWQFSTHSEHSGNNIISIFDKVKEWTGGNIKGVPFDLTVEMVKSQKMGDTKIFPIVNLIPNLSTESLEKLREFSSNGLDLNKKSLIFSDELIKSYNTHNNENQRSLIM